MKVARLHGTRDIRVEDEPLPEVPPGHSLVRVTAVGLCGSDLHWYAEGGIGDDRLDRPLVLGHEFAGVIAGGPRDGEHVAVDPAMPCGTCDLCKEGHRNLCVRIGFAGNSFQDGALREYLPWPTELLLPLPDGLSDTDGAMLEPLGVAIHAVDLGHLRLGATVGVFGCGPIGLLLLQVARAAGATTVIAVDPLPHRLAAAQRLGADLIVTPDELANRAGDLSTLARRAGGDEHGVHVAFEVAGTDDAVDLAVGAARPGGRVVLVGIPEGDRTSFPASAARRKGLSILVSRRMKEVYPRAMDLVASGRVDVRSVVTATHPLGEVDKAFAAAAARTGLKIVVDPSRD
jgi:L-iditol 2-dehydrogenase